MKPQPPTPNAPPDARSEAERTLDAVRKLVCPEQAPSPIQQPAPPKTSPSESPYLTTDEAAAYLRYPSRKAFIRHAHQFGIPRIRRGKRYFFTKRSLDEFMQVVTELSAGGRHRRVPL